MPGRVLPVQLPSVSSVASDWWGVADHGCVGQTGGELVELSGFSFVRLGREERRTWPCGLWRARPE